jgi:glucokinase
MARAIGVDLGGSHVMAAVVEEDGTIKDRHEVDIVDHRVDAVLEAMESAINGALSDVKSSSIVGIGVGSPGNIDPRTGLIRYSPNFQWTNVPLGERLRSLFSYPVYIANDARCATLGEFTYGVGRGTKDFVLLTLGTGIGGGIVSDGNLLVGNAMGAGEFGHHTIRPVDGFICGCGKTGCFEAQASGTGLIRHALAVAPSFPRSPLLDIPREKWGSKKIRQAAAAGDDHALAAWNRWVDDLANGLSNIIAFVNPEVIALGGGVSSAGDFLVGAVVPKVEERTTMVPRGTTRIVTASLINDAGAVGSATLAFRGGLTTGQR